MESLHLMSDLRPPPIDRVILRGLRFLAREQRADGSWVPLWFGNQHHPEEENPVYGTARVLLAYRDLGRYHEAPAGRGARWLTSAQNPDGGWGGAPRGSSGGAFEGVSSVEETAVAVEALISAQSRVGPEPELRHGVKSTVDRGLAWLVEAVESGRHRKTSPIGFYFARLWYYERLYPLVFSVAALGEAVRWRSGQPGLEKSRPGPTETAR
jgi:squalene-hopene/tetraprenyl-beta-curcumene cyclase